ncbi:AsnC family transcriptional regulator [Loktanella sp. 1ANDIMAR09]|uniref:Transcriptional regulator, AsnC family n=1 Tax=Yoonia rosea TaxID=287098 RepID=A0A1R3X280_9RHOB|nr:Lrp/AsnC family transcriptional regulator [Yoonia rosea]KQB97330.1 AsnC family transcriptional regulator [Loktanella sp. 1ANDIMAR09]SIT84605.1 transcriptional regulator, AsnC family [Yoonia rosea]
MLDTFERLILKVLQRNGRASTHELSEAVGLSPSPCWRRMKRLEEDGYILRYAAILDSKKLGLHAFAHVQVSLVDHSEATIRAFEAFIERDQHVLECASITGDFDFILKIAAKDPEALEQFIMQQILRLGVVRTTTTNFILRQMKVSGGLPIDV